VTRAIPVRRAAGHGTEGMQQLVQRQLRDRVGLRLGVDGLLAGVQDRHEPAGLRAVDRMPAVVQRLVGLPIDGARDRGPVRPDEQVALDAVVGRQGGAHVGGQGGEAPGGAASGVGACGPWQRHRHEVQELGTACRPEVEAHALAVARGAGHRGGHPRRGALQQVGDRDGPVGTVGGTRVDDRDLRRRRRLVVGVGVGLGRPAPRAVADGGPGRHGRDGSECCDDERAAARGSTIHRAIPPSGRLPWRAVVRDRTSVEAEGPQICDRPAR
jgi:hypothetical protein